MNKYYLYPLMAVLIWSGNTVISKMAAGSIQPMQIAFLRWALAALLFTPFVLPAVWRNRRAIYPHLGKLLVLSVLGLVLYQSLAYYAAHMTTATNMGIILSLMPLMTLLLAIVVLRQYLTYGGLIGCLVSLAGILIVVSHGEPAQLLHQGVGYGDLLMLLATFCYALYGVLLKKWPMQLPFMQSLYMQVILTVMVLLPFYLLSPQSPFTVYNIGLILYAGIPTSMAAPLFWLKGIGQLGPSRTAMLINLSPILTALIAAGVLGEALAAYHLYGGLLTIGGVLLTERWRRTIRFNRWK